MREQHSNRPPKSEGVVIALAAILIAFLAIQPAFVSRDPNRQAEFAWEMYSKSAPRDEFVIVSPAGRELVTVTDVQPRGLATVDYTEVLPPFICERQSDATAVEVLRGGTLLRVYECSP